MLRVASHKQQVAAILHESGSQRNDKYVAPADFYVTLKSLPKGVLPTCQDTGTAIIMGKKKGQRVWTGGGDEAALTVVFTMYLHRTQPALLTDVALDMYKETNHRHQPACTNRFVQRGW